MTKRSFTLISAPDQVAAPDVRIANALEHIAHYLDRIDDHLEAIATQLKAGGAETVKELTDIAESVRAISNVAG